MFLLMTLTVVIDAQKVKNAEILTKLSEMHEQQLKMMEALNHSKSTSGGHKTLLKLPEEKLARAHLTSPYSMKIIVQCCKNGTLQKTTSCGAETLCTEVCDSKANNNFYLIPKQY